MTGARGALIVIAAAVIGTAATAGTHHAPGYLLGAFVVAGTLVAALAVRPRAVYLLIPVPALAYMVGALTAGLIHQQSASPGSSGLTVSVAQWIADGFVTMVAATALAAAIAIIRWLGHRNARPAAAPPEPEPVFPARPTSRTVFTVRARLGLVGRAAAGRRADGAGAAIVALAGGAGDAGLTGGAA